MENASKALIIAGAILVSILIVGLGVIIYNNVQDVATSGTLDTQQISAHNSPFQGYFGDYVSGSNVKGLFTQIQANNNAANANGEKIGNYIYVIDSSNQPVTSSDILTGRTYSVDLPATEGYTDTDAAGEAYWKNGYIKTIVVQVNS